MPPEKSSNLTRKRKMWDGGGIQRDTKVNGRRRHFLLSVHLDNVAYLLCLFFIKSVPLATERKSYNFFFFGYFFLFFFADYHNKALFRKSSESLFLNLLSLWGKKRDRPVSKALLPSVLSFHPGYRYATTIYYKLNS